MKSLLAVEFRRILARRIVRVAGLMALLGFLIAGLVLFVRSHRLDPTIAATLRAQAEAQYQNDLAACSAGEFGIPPTDIPPEVTLEEFCKQIIQRSGFPDPGFHLTHYRTAAEGLSGLFIAILTALAASFAGAEWHTGVMTTQLTWEPRRSRLLAAKTLAAAGFAFTAFLLAESALLATVLPAATFRGTTVGADPAWLRGTIGILLRAATTAALAAAIGHALASLARNTAVAVGAVLGYAAVLEPLLRAVRPRWEPWFLVGNAARFITAQPLDVNARSRSTGGAAAMLAIYAMGSVALAFAFFRRRDVT